MKGRRPGSPVRTRIAAILDKTGPLYGYQIYKIYRVVFGDVCMRTIYYNLKSGAVKKEFIVKEIKKEKGNYTWGPEAEKIYYSIGPNANIHILSENEKSQLKSIVSN
jgi:hypothetical protein